MLKVKQIICTIKIIGFTTAFTLWVLHAFYCINCTCLDHAPGFFYLGVPQTDPDNSAQGAKSKNCLGRTSSGPVGPSHAKDGVYAMISLDFIIRRPFWGGPHLLNRGILYFFSFLILCPKILLSKRFEISFGMSGLLVSVNDAADRSRTYEK